MYQFMNSDFKGKIKLKGLIKLYKILKKEKPDVVQTWMYHADLVGGIVSRLAGIKYILEFKKFVLYY